LAEARPAHGLCRQDNPGSVQFGLSQAGCPVVTITPNTPYWGVHLLILTEFYQVAFRKRIYTALDQLQKDVYEWIEQYDRERTHTGKHCVGRTPLQTFRDTKHLAQQKMLDTLW